MSRIALQILLPLLLPTVAFFLWAWLAPRFGIDSRSNVLQTTPWFWLIIAGVLLMGVGLTATALTQGAAPGSEIIQPRLEDGRVVPAQVR
jgi:hypothetical protein